MTDSDYIDIETGTRGMNPPEDGQTTALSTMPASGAWSPMLIFDLALEIDPLEDILLRHDTSWEEYNMFNATLSFRRDLIMAQKEIAEQGVSFKRKAALQAEQYLLEMHTLMMSVSTPASTRVDIFKTLAKLGELEPEKKTKDDIASGGVAYNIQINIQK